MAVNMSILCLCAKQNVILKKQPETTVAQLHNQYENDCTKLCLNCHLVTYSHIVF